MQKEIEESEKSPSAVMAKIRSTSQKFDAWCSFWDKTFAGTINQKPLEG